MLIIPPILQKELEHGKKNKKGNSLLRKYTSLGHVKK